MPEYYDGIPGRKPSEKQLQDLAQKEHDQKHQVRQEAAKRHAEAHKQPGPAERMYSQDRHINQNEPGNRNERSNQRTEPTQAQLEMKAKREAARAEDQREAKADVGKKEYPAWEPSKKPEGPSR